MESVAHITCQWHQCQSAAEQHAVFGRRVFEVKTAHITGENALFVAKHRDLCGRHLAQLRLQYVDVVAMPLGSCCEHDALAQAGT